jgi:inner membrane protein
MILGAALWALCAKVSGLPPAEPVALTAAVTGSLLPDLDHPQSWAGRKFKIISVPLSAVVGHRGVTHSLLAVIACFAAVVWFGMSNVATPIAIGYLSHLLADGLTPSGVPLLWPNRRRFAIPVCKTGTAAEMVVVAAIAAMGGWAAGLDLSRLPRPNFPFP